MFQRGLGLVPLCHTYEVQDCKVTLASTPFLSLGVRGHLDVQERCSHRSQSMGDLNNAQVTDMCSSHQTASSLSAHCPGSSYGVPCWTCLEAQLLETLMWHKHVNRVDRMKELVWSSGTSGTDWTSHRMPHRRWRPLEVTSSPFGMAFLGMVLLSRMPLTSNPSSTAISLFQLRTFILD